jgi:CheY-like chemotaxis protein
LRAILQVLGAASFAEPGIVLCAAPEKRTSRRILLAEDNAVNQTLARRMLEKHGYSVVVVSDGALALEAVEKECFDLILMDVQMPRMDGLEAARAIRQREKAAGGHMPIIALTAHAMKGDRDRCVEAGMDRYISKPIRMKELLEAIESVVPSGPLDAVLP